MDAVIRHQRCRAGIRNLGANGLLTVLYPSWEHGAAATGTLRPCSSVTTSDRLGPTGMALGLFRCCRRTRRQGIGKAVVWEGLSRRRRSMPGVLLAAIRITTGRFGPRRFNPARLRHAGGRRLALLRLAFRWAYPAGYRRYSTTAFSADGQPGGCRRCCCSAPDSHRSADLKLMLLDLRPTSTDRPRWPIDKSGGRGGRRRTSAETVI